MTKIDKPLPVPKVCDECGGVRVTRKFDPNSNRYRYICRECRASVNCHEGTLNPLGRMANQYTKDLRALAHKELDPIWLHGLLTRDECYEWIARKVDVDVDAAHIGTLSDADLRFVIAKAGKFYRKLLSGSNTSKGISDASNRRQRERVRTRQRGGKWHSRPTRGPR